MKTEIDRVQLEEDIEKVCWWTDIESAAAILERSLQLWDHAENAVISANVNLNKVGIQEIRFSCHGPIITVVNVQTDQTSVLLRATRERLQTVSERLWINFILPEPAEVI